MILDLEPGAGEQGIAAVLGNPVCDILLDNENKQAINTKTQKQCDLGSPIGLDSLKYLFYNKIILIVIINYCINYYKIIL